MPTADRPLSGSEPSRRGTRRAAINRLLPLVCVAIVGVLGILSAPRVLESRGALRRPHPEDRAAKVPSGDWNQWGGSPARNNAVAFQGVPADWSAGQFDRETGRWIEGSGRNLKWVAQLGSQTYGNPVVAGGKVFVGTNNGAGYLERYPAEVDLGCLLCFRESDGAFLWQYSSEKLPTGRAHDWPLTGICSAPLVEGGRLWLVTNRGEVVCLDAEGFLDNQNDGPFRNERREARDEADVVWRYDMMRELGVSQHNMATCAPTAWGDVLFICTSNGVDESHSNIPAPNAPSFIALDKHTGGLLWTDNSPGQYILHGQWSCPAVGVFDGVPQVLFAGGDGWLYSFRADRWQNGRPEPLWKFDCNPRQSRFNVFRRTRNSILAIPVVYDGLVYLAVGDDPEHGEGEGHLWCIDPTKRGDVSAELAVRADDGKTPLPHRRLHFVIPEQGEMAVPNANSAAVWHYTEYDWDGDGMIAEFEEEMHRTLSSPAIKDGLLVIPDISGLLHCLDAKSGKVHWTFDLYASTWGSALIAGDRIYVGDEEGKVSIFRLSADPDMAMKKNAEGGYEPIAQVELSNSVYTTPIVANNVLYIANKTHLFAIADQEPSRAAAPRGER